MKLPSVKQDIQIRYADLDPLDHVSNTVYGQYFELGRIGWYEAILAKCPKAVLPITVVASVNTNYIIEVRLGDSVYVTTSCTKKGNKSFQLSQDLYSNGKLATSSIVTMVGFNKETRQTCEPLIGWEPSSEDDIINE